MQILYIIDITDNSKYRSYKFAMWFLILFILFDELINFSFNLCIIVRQVRASESKFPCRDIKNKRNRKSFTT